MAQCCKPGRHILGLPRFWPPLPVSRLRVIFETPGRALDRDLSVMRGNERWRNWHNAVTPRRRCPGYAAPGGLRRRGCQPWRERRVSPALTVLAPPFALETDEASASPLLSGLSRPRYAALGLAASHCGRPPLRAGRAASAASAPRPPAKAGGRGVAGKKWLCISYPSPGW